ncbi:MAG: helix-turn-helix domain-containing protein [Nitrospinae bacterium]|nr:helix-turn-helix domain-containing protein [Nitrospinota bacterium]
MRGPTLPSVIRITVEQVCQVIALACDDPPTSGRPMSHWTSREIAEEIVTRGIVAHIALRHAARLLHLSC